MKERLPARDLEVVEKALRVVVCPNGHEYIVGVDGPPCPVDGRSEFTPISRRGAK